MRVNSETKFSINTNNIDGNWNKIEHNTMCGFWYL